MSSSVPMRMTIQEFRDKYGEFCSLQGERMKLVLPLRNQQVAAEALRNMYQERLSRFETYVIQGTLPAPDEPSSQRQVANTRQHPPAFRPKMEVMHAEKAVGTPAVSAVPKVATPPVSHQQTLGATGKTLQPVYQQQTNLRPSLQSSGSAPAPGGIQGSQAAQPMGAIAPPARPQQMNSSMPHLQASAPISKNLSAPAALPQALPGTLGAPIVQTLGPPAATQSRRDPRQASAAASGPPMSKPAAPISRDPRLRARNSAAVTANSQPRPTASLVSPAVNTQVSMGVPFPAVSHPLLALQQARRPQMAPQVTRPTSDPFATFSPNSQLHANVSAAMAAHRRANQNARDVQHGPPASGLPQSLPSQSAAASGAYQPSKPGNNGPGAGTRPGFMPLVMPLLAASQGTQPTIPGSQPLNRPSQQRPAGTQPLTQQLLPNSAMTQPVSRPLQPNPAGKQLVHQPSHLNLPGSQLSSRPGQVNPAGNQVVTKALQSMLPESRPLSQPPQATGNPFSRARPAGILPFNQALQPNAVATQPSSQAFRPNAVSNQLPTRPQIGQVGSQLMHQPPQTSAISQPASQQTQVPMARAQPIFRPVQSRVAAPQGLVRPLQQNPGRGRPQKPQSWSQNRRASARKRALSSASETSEGSVFESSPSPQELAAQASYKEAPAAKRARGRPRKQVSISIMAHAPNASGRASTHLSTAWEMMMELKPIAVLRNLHALAAGLPHDDSSQTRRNSSQTSGDPGGRIGDQALDLDPLQQAFLTRYRRTHWEEEPPPRDFSPLERSPELGDVRRSRRARARPAQFVPSFGRAKRGRTDDDDDGQIRVGPDHQAILPDWKPKPPPGSVPAPQEAQWLTHLVSERGSYAEPGDCAPIISLPPSANGERRFAIHGRMQRLLTALEVVEFGLDKMGSAEAAGWSDSEIRRFEEGLNENARDFDLIARSQLPEKGPHRVTSFYYNVWKTRAIPQAKEWYRKRDEDRAREQLEELVAASLRIEAQAAQLARRQLKEGLGWLRSFARQPIGGHISKVKADRMSRATLVLAKANMLRQQQA